MALYVLSVFYCMFCARFAFPVALYVLSVFCDVALYLLSVAETDNPVAPSTQNAAVLIRTNMQTYIFEFPSNAFRICRGCRESDSRWRMASRLYDSTRGVIVLMWV